MKIKTIFEGHTAETRYPVAIGDIQGDPASLRGVTVSLWRMTAAILASLIITIPAFATDPDPVAKKTVASKYYVDTTKQDIIPVNKVLAIGDGTGENDIYVPSIVTTNAAGTTLTGNSVGLLTYEALDSAAWALMDFDQVDNFVPTTAAVMSEINTRQFNIDSTDESFVYDSSTNRYADGSVVVTTDNEGSVDQRGIATAPVYNNQNQLTNGDWLPTMAAVETKQSKLTCAGYVDGHEGDLDYCWLYGEVEVACKTTNESCEYNGECCSNNCVGKSGKNKTCFGSEIGF